MKDLPRHCYRSRLRHRFFFALIASIFVAMAISGIIVHSFTDQGRDTYAFRTFAEEQFLSVWRDKDALLRLVTSIERSFPVRLGLQDAEGNAWVEHHGQMACNGRVDRVEVNDSGILLGTVEVCFLGRSGHHLLLLLLGSFLLVLWGFSGVFSRWLVRPLDELVRVARAIGDGDLSARMQLHHCRPHHGHRVRLPGEVETVALAVNQMADKIERQIAAQRELLAAVSHEVRSPLARLRMLVELSRESPGDASRLDAMDVELSEMDSLIGQLLAQSRIEFQGVLPRVIAAAEVAKVALSRANCSSDVLDDRSSSEMVSVDAGLFGRMLVNLIENAKRHGGGLVALQVVLEKDAVVFKVIDHGPGFDEAALSSAFLPFVGSGKESGLGLGLALAKRIADAHGAKLEVRSVPFVETAVCVTMPLAAGA